MQKFRFCREALTCKPTNKHLDLFISQQCQHSIIANSYQQTRLLTLLKIDFLENQGRRRPVQNNYFLLLTDDIILMPHKCLKQLFTINCKSQKLCMGHKIIFTQFALSTWLKIHSGPVSGALLNKSRFIIRGLDACVETIPAINHHALMVRGK